jgi:Conserved in the green lineage and diatoms 27
MKPSAPVCPVPTEQQPLNEYQQLSESWFYRWATLDLGKFLKPIVILWFLGWLVAAPVAILSFPFHKYPGHFLLSGALGAAIPPTLALLQLWLGWVYVRDRLSKAEIFYEESGWYDGQTWEKPDEVLQRDRLIVTYQIQPLLNRLHQTFGILGAIFLTGIVTWNFI